jgi:hypothetical protein
MFSQIRFGIAATLLVAVWPLMAQQSAPRVFTIGTFEWAFEKLQFDYSYQLLTVGNDNIDEAYDMWLHMLRAMESHDEGLPYFDLKGINIWLYVFWNKDGSIAHLAYYLKPNSRFVKEEELTGFFTSFTDYYRLPMEAPAMQRFSHYGSAFFPTASIKLTKR